MVTQNIIGEDEQHPDKYLKNNICSSASIIGGAKKNHLKKLLKNHLK